MVETLLQFQLTAFSFLYPGVLGWLAVACIPIVIHLFSRRRRVKADWPAMRWLAAAVQARRRRIWFANRGVLFLRILAICLIAFAAAGPTGSTGRFDVTSGSVHHVLVIDGSYSMLALRYHPDEVVQAPWDGALEAAQNIVREAPGGDSFSLIVMARPSESVTSRPLEDRGTVLSLLENLDPPQTDFDLASALSLVEQSIDASEARPTPARRHFVHVLTDLRRHGWAVPEDANSVVEQRLRRIAAKARVQVVELEAGCDANTAVTELELEEGVPVAGREATVSGVVRFFPSGSKNPLPSGTTAELYLDGRLVGSREVSFTPAGEGRVTYPVRFERPGEHVLEMRLPEDVLRLDNRRFLVVEVPDQIRVLVVRPPEEAADYLRAALAAEDPEKPGIRVVSISESQLATVRIETFDAVFLDGVTEVGADGRAELEGFIRRGGTLVVFPPTTENVGGPNGLLGGLSAFTLSERVSLDEPATLRAVVPTSPFLRPFIGNGAGALLSTPVFSYYHLARKSIAHSAETILAAGDAPLLVETRIGRGRVFLAAVPLDPGWTGLPLWPSFVPLVREVSVLGAAGRGTARNVFVGEPLRGELEAIGGLRALEMGLPDGSRRRLPHKATPSGIEWTYLDTRSSGLYSLFSILVAASDGERDPRPLGRWAVNLRTAESDLFPMDTKYLARRFPAFGAPDHDLAATDAQFRRSLASGTFWTSWLLLAGVAILLLETWTATVPFRNGAR